jgi:hypothetical protein
MAGPLLSFSKPCASVRGAAPREDAHTFTVRPTLALPVSAIQPVVRPPECVVRQVIAAASILQSQSGRYPPTRTSP